MLGRFKNLYFSLYGKLLFNTIKHSTEIECLVINEEIFNKTSQYLFTTWHSNIILCLFLLNNDRVGMIFNNLNVLLSGNPVNGTILPSLEQKGIKYLRGTVSQDSAIKNTRLIIKKIKQNESVFTPIDGPLGPAKEIKRGFIFLSQKYDVPIIPIGVAIDNSKILKDTWDQTRMFNRKTKKIVFYFGEELYFNTSNVDENKRILKESIDHANRIAETYL